MTEPSEGLTEVTAEEIERFEREVEEAVSRVDGIEIEEFTEYVVDLVEFGVYSVVFSGDVLENYLSVHEELSEEMQGSVKFPRSGEFDQLLYVHDFGGDVFMEFGESDLAQLDMFVSDDFEYVLDVEELEVGQISESLVEVRVGSEEEMWDVWDFFDGLPSVRPIVCGRVPDSSEYAVMLTSEGYDLREHLVFSVVDPSCPVCDSEVVAISPFFDFMVCRSCFTVVSIEGITGLMDFESDSFEELEEKWWDGFQDSLLNRSYPGLELLEEASSWFSEEGDLYLVERKGHSVLDDCFVGPYPMFLFMYREDEPVWFIDPIEGRELDVFELGEGEKECDICGGAADQERAVGGFSEEYGFNGSGGPMLFAHVCEECWNVRESEAKELVDGVELPHSI